jgi:hypothetical protein
MTLHSNPIFRLVFRPFLYSTSEHHSFYFHVSLTYSSNNELNVSITSFNEWGEGTQIEPAKKVSEEEFKEKKYLNYGNKGPYLYLNLTAEFSHEFLHESKLFREEL